MLLFCYVLSISVFLYPIRPYNTRLLSVPSNSFCSWWFARFRTLGGELGSCLVCTLLLACRCAPPAVREPRWPLDACASTTAGSGKMRLVGRLASVPFHATVVDGRPGRSRPPWPEAKLQAQGDGGNGEAAARVPSAVSFHPRAGALRRPRTGGGDHHRHGGRWAACLLSFPTQPPRPRRALRAWSVAGRGRRAPAPPRLARASPRTVAAHHCLVRGPRRRSLSGTNE